MGAFVAGLRRAFPLFKTHSAKFRVGVAVLVLACYGWYARDLYWVLDWQGSQYQKPGVESERCFQFRLGVMAEEQDPTYRQCQQKYLAQGYTLVPDSDYRLSWISR